MDDIFSPRGLAAGPVQVVWREGQFELQLQGRPTRISAVLEPEDVSYVSSPYVPDCVRLQLQPRCSNNAARRDECQAGACGIATDLSEVLVLDRVRIMVSEWVPFGHNQIVAMNNRLGSMERCQGGFLTGAMDNDCESSADMTFVQRNMSLTEVSLLDFTMESHVNFEAQLRFPEAPGIVQVEHVGVNVQSGGTLNYGVLIEGAHNRVDGKRISLDVLSRIVADLTQDTSTLIDDLISSYQCSLLELVHVTKENNANRYKYTMAICEDIHPHLPAEEYFDKEEKENELKQIVGSTLAAYDIGADGKLVLGDSGLVYSLGECGKAQWPILEPILMAHARFASLSIFMRTYFTRVFMMNATLHEVQELIDHFR